MKIKAVDLTKGEPACDFGFFEQIQGDAFKTKKPHQSADVIFHRWFLHHCTTSQKEEHMAEVVRVLRGNGKLVIVDWFVPDWEGNGFADSCRKYYAYHAKFGIAPSKTRQDRAIADVEAPTGKGGKFTSTVRFEKLIEKYGFVVTEKRTLAPDGVEDPELFGQYIYVCERGPAKAPTFTNHFMSSPALVDAAIRNIDVIGLHYPNPKVIFDIGANVGVFSCLMAKRFPNAVIYSFEAMPQNYAVLMENIQNNNLVGRVFPYNVALWSEMTNLRFGMPKKRNKENTGLYSAFFGDNDDYKTTGIKLDDVVEIKPDLAKIDVEGSEYHVLSGGRNVLSELNAVYIEKGKTEMPEFPPYEMVEIRLEAIGLSLLSTGHDEIWIRQPT